MACTTSSRISSASACYWAPYASKSIHNVIYACLRFLQALLDLAASEANWLDWCESLERNGSSTWLRATPFRMHAGKGQIKPAKCPAGWKDGVHYQSRAQTTSVAPDEDRMGHKMSQNNLLHLFVQNPKCSASSRWARGLRCQFFDLGLPRSCEGMSEQLDGQLLGSLSLQFGVSQGRLGRSELQFGSSRLRIFKPKKTAVEGHCRLGLQTWSFSDAREKAMQGSFSRLSHLSPLTLIVSVFKPVVDFCLYLFDRACARFRKSKGNKWIRMTWWLDWVHVFSLSVLLKGKQGGLIWSGEWLEQQECAGTSAVENSARTQSEKTPIQLMPILAFRCFVLDDSGVFSKRFYRH